MDSPYEAKTQDACNRRKNDMDEQTQLKDSILAQAHEKGRKLLEEAKETILKEETARRAFDPRQTQSTLRAAQADSTSIAT